MNPWISVVGIGEDGLDGLGARGQQVRGGKKSLFRAARSKRLASLAINITANKNLGMMVQMEMVQMVMVGMVEMEMEQEMGHENI